MSTRALSSIIKPYTPYWTSPEGAILLEFPSFGADAGDPTLAAGPYGEECEPEAPAGPDPQEIAARIIAEAKERAQEIVAEAQARAEAIVEAARTEGYARGEEEARACWSERLLALDQRAAEIAHEQAEFFKAAEPELAALSMDIARKVLKQELALSPEAVLTVVRACMHRLKEKEARIRVNPKDLDTVRGARESFLCIADGMAEIEIVSDRRVGLGGCIVETPSGNIDARLETQLDHIEQVLVANVEDPGDVCN